MNLATMRLPALLVLVCAKRTAYLCGLIFVLSGCAGTPPASDPWAEIEVPTESAERPLELPQWPLPTSFTDSSATFGLEAVRALEAHRVVADANTAIATAHAGQIDELRAAAGYLVEAGAAQRRVADLRLEILQEERRSWLWQKMGYLTGYLLIAVAIAL